MIDKKNLKNLKIVIFDIDGTLISDEGIVGSKSLELIKELKSAGLLFSLASGRLFSEMVEFADVLEIDTPIISLDGTFISNRKNEIVIGKSFVPHRSLNKIIDYSDKFLFKVAFCQPTKIIFPEFCPDIPDLIERKKTDFTQVFSLENNLDNVVEALCISDIRGNIKYVEKKLSFPYSFGLQTKAFKIKNNDKVYCLEIRKKGASKKEAFFKLLKYLKINVKNAAVIGDWYNDIPLFETKAVKVALKNAVSEIKHKADIVIEKTNNEDGTADFLKMVLEAKTK